MSEPKEENTSDDTTTDTQGSIVNKKKVINYSKEDLAKYDHLINMSQMYAKYNQVGVVTGGPDGLAEISMVELESGRADTHNEALQAQTQSHIQTAPASLSLSRSGVPYMLNHHHVMESSVVVTPFVGQQQQPTLQPSELHKENLLHLSNLVQAQQQILQQSTYDF